MKIPILEHIAAEVGPEYIDSIGRRKRRWMPMRRQIEKFWTFVKVKGENECWECTKTPDKQTGYCDFCYRGESGSAHRFSWLIHFGEIPPGVCVCHKCDNRICVNPSHLWLGTKGDNNRDMFEKGRGRTVPRSKLTPFQVFQIRRVFLNGGSGRSPEYGRRVGTSRIAREFGVTYKLIESALNTKHWKNVPWQ